MVEQQPRNDKGYGQLGYAALMKIHDQLGAEVTVADGVAVNQAVETFRQFANQGYKIIFGWGGQFGDAAKQVAPQFPNTYFVVNDGVGGNGKNLAAVGLASQEWTYLEGYSDASVSKTGKLGFVAGPCLDVTSREFHGWQQGAKVANPSVSIRVIHVSDFDDAAGAKEAALTFMQNGVDVMHTALSGANFGVYAAVKGTKVLVSAPFYDQHSAAPQNIYTSDIRDATVVGVVAVQQITSGKFNGQPIMVHITAADEGIAPYNGLAPDALYQKIKTLQAQIASGSTSVVADGSCPF